MNAPGKSMIKVVSILMLIFSSISLIVLFVSLIGSVYISAYYLSVLSRRRRNSDIRTHNIICISYI